MNDTNAILLRPAARPDVATSQLSVASEHAGSVVMLHAFTSLAEVAACLQRSGADLYGGEQVTQLAHALQCATLAEADGSTPALITAALLHDIGHLTGQVDRQAPHSELGAKLLAGLFGRDVTEPIRLHVSAKRYLCAVDSIYWSELSEASRQSLAWQGGPYTTDQAKRFITQPFADDAVRVRRWDDAAKIPGRATRSLEECMTVVQRACLLSDNGLAFRPGT